MLDKTNRCLIRRPICSLILVGCAATVLAAPVDRPAAAPVVNPAPAVVNLAVPVVRIAVLDWNGDIDQAIERLDRFVAHGEGGMARVDRHVKAANWLMAEPLAEPATALMLGLDPPLPAGDAARLLQAALAHLDAAESQWQPLRDSDDVDDNARWQRTDQIDGLQSFVAALGVIWPDNRTTEPVTPSELRTAASALSVVLESDRSEVAAAGQLWQAYLYRRAGDDERSFDLLPPAMKKMNGAGAFGYYGRLFRCLYAGTERGAPVAAQALLAGLAARAVDWFETDDERKAAQRLTAFVRRRVLTVERERFAAAKRADQVAWFDRAIARVDEKYFARPAENAILALPGAAPAFADLRLARAAVIGGPIPPPPRIGDPR